MVAIDRDTLLATGLVAGMVLAGWHARRPPAVGGRCRAGQGYARGANRCLTYNVPVDSTRADKRYMVLAKAGDRVRLVHFSDPAYRRNYSPAARRRFHARHRCAEKTDRLTAGWWACNHAW